MPFTDPYLDENGMLRNLLGAKSPEELQELEPQIVFANQLELESLAIPRTNDLQELLLIHGQLFKGVYDWAGQIRTVDIKKNEDGTEFFLIFGKITDAVTYIFAELAKENYLKGLESADFVRRLAHHYDQLNFKHWVIRKPGEELTLVSNGWDYNAYRPDDSLVMPE